MESHCTRKSGNTENSLSTGASERSDLMWSACVEPAISSQSVLTKVNLSKLCVTESVVWIWMIWADYSVPRDDWGLASRKVKRVFEGVCLSSCVYLGTMAWSPPEGFLFLTRWVMHGNLFWELPATYPVHHTALDKHVLSSGGLLWSILCYITGWRQRFWRTLSSPSQNLCLFVCQT